MNFEDFTPAMLSAFEKTVLAYERLIWVLESGTDEAIEIEVYKWHGYSSVPTCHLCQTSRKDNNGSLNCATCILTRTRKRSVPCVTPCVDGSTMANLHREFRRRNVFVCDDLENKALLKAVKARLAWILKRADQNGVTI